MQAWSFSKSELRRIQKKKAICRQRRQRKMAWRGRG
jgi:hypothetical protein